MVISYAYSEATCDQPCWDGDAVFKSTSRASRVLQSSGPSRAPYWSAPPRFNWNISGLTYTWHCSACLICSRSWSTNCFRTNNCFISNPLPLLYFVRQLTEQTGATIDTQIHVFSHPVSVVGHCNFAISCLTSSWQEPFGQSLSNSKMWQPVWGRCSSSSSFLYEFIHHPPESLPKCCKHLCVPCVPLHLRVIH